VLAGGPWQVKVSASQPENCPPQQLRLVRLPRRRCRLHQRARQGRRDQPSSLARGARGCAQRWIDRRDADQLVASPGDADDHRTAVAGPRERKLGRPVGQLVGEQRP